MTREEHLDRILAYAQKIKHHPPQSIHHTINLILEKTRPPQHHILTIISELQTHYLHACSNCKEVNYHSYLKHINADPVCGALGLETKLLCSKCQ